MTQRVPPRDPDQILANTDWFAPAAAREQSVRQGLEAVETLLTRRQGFVAALSDNLVRLSSSEFDAITDLTRRIKQLDDSLQFRLGLLRPERVAAWFRPAATDAWGPFQSAMLREPVLPQYGPNDAGKLRHFVARAWQDGMTLQATFVKPGGSLLTMLLELNAQWHRITRMSEPFSEVDLAAESPALPEGLWSPMLALYLQKVRAALQQARQRLDQVYLESLQRCEQVWQIQEQLSSQQTKRTTGSSQDRANQWRQEFKDRRRAAGATSGVGRIHAALRCLGFDAEPNLDELRSRYRQLARRFHPDLNGGDDAKFKDISAAYRLLQARIAGPGK